MSKKLIIFDTLEIHSVFNGYYNKFLSSHMSKEV